MKNIRLTTRGLALAAIFGVALTTAGCGKSGKERALEKERSAPSGQLRERLAQTQDDR